MAGKKSSSDNGVHITIPLDRTTVNDRGGLGSVRVLLRDGSGEVTSKEVKVGKGGKAEVGFDLPGPRALQVIIGPPDATDEELRGLQTLTVDVPRRAWGEKAERRWARRTSGLERARIRRTRPLRWPPTGRADGCG